MRKSYISVGIIGLLIAGGLFFLWNRQNFVFAPAGSLKIAVTIFPVYDIVRNIAGDKAEVVLILPAGASPHTFEAQPEMVKQIFSSRLIFQAGIVDDWVSGLLGESAPDVELIVLNQAFEPWELEPKEDPHFWLDMTKGEIAANIIFEKFSELDPENKEYYQANLDVYLRELAEADQRLKDKLSAVSGRKMIVFHEAWNHFAKAYSLEIAAVFQPSPGKESTTQEIKKIADAVQKYGIKAIFSEPQLADDVLQSLADDLGLKIYVLDPLGGIKDRDSYIKMMEYNAEVIYNALRN